MTESLDVTTIKKERNMNKHQKRVKTEMHKIFMIRRRRRTGKLLSNRPNRFWFVCGFLDNLFLDFTTDNHWRSHIWSKEQKLLGLFGKPYTDDNHNLHGDVLKFWFQTRPGITCIFFTILWMPTPNISQSQIFREYISKQNQN